MRCDTNTIMLILKTNSAVCLCAVLSPIKRGPPEAVAVEGYQHSQDTAPLQSFGASLQPAAFTPARKTAAGLWPRPGVDQLWNLVSAALGSVLPIRFGLK